MNVAVVILNWNGKKLLEKFLPSVVTHSKNHATVYIADNASTDNSIIFLTKYFPEVKIIKNSHNYGYAKGYNEALKQLSEDIFVLLNNDVEVTENWLYPIVNEMINNNKLVAAQPKLLDYKSKDFFEYAGAAGGYIDQLAYPYCRGRIFNTIEKEEHQYDDQKTIFWASGACLFVKKEAFWNAGGMDEDFFAHQEEIDLCWRLQTNGGIIKYFSQSSVFHLGGATLSNANPKKTFYNFRNSLLMLFKNRKGISTYLLLFIRLILDGIAGVVFVIQAKPMHCLAIIKAHFSFYYLIPKFLKKKRKHASNLNYFSIKSIVYLYFIKKKRTFNKL
ncbi:MAG: glycosyltransferase family 2 protein [Flavobacteriales bacterium]